MAEPFRLCTMCAVAHYDTCPDCRGWGRKVGGDGSVTAREAHDVHRNKRLPAPHWTACPTCQSDWRGPASSEVSAGETPQLAPNRIQPTEAGK